MANSFTRLVGRWLLGWPTAALPGRLVPILRRLCVGLCLYSCAALSAGAPDALNIAVISDLNGRYGQVGYHGRVAAAVREIIRRRPDVVLCTGDMVAGQRLRPLLTRAELIAMWEGFEDTVRQPLADAGIPLMFTPGNHDASPFAGFQLERQVYAERFAGLPQGLDLLEDHSYPFYYAAVFRGVLLVSIDAARNGALSSTQRSWLAQILATQDAATPRIVFGHLPLQPVARGREREIVSDAALERLLASGNTLYLSGHHHVFYPGRRAGITMVSVPNLGGNLRGLIGSGQRTDFGYLWLQLIPGEPVTVSMWRGSQMQELFEWRALPEAIGEGSSRLTRLPLP